MKLEEIDSELAYRKGEENTQADCLSHQTYPTAAVISMEDDNEQWKTQQGESQQPAEWSPRSLFY